MDDSIENTINLKAPVSRVWQALTDYKEFGTWFQVNLDGPFVVGELSTGQMTYPGAEHMKWEALVKAIDPKHFFSYTWCPFGGDVDVDYSDQPQTLVEFRLEVRDAGSRLVISESGFSALPEDQRRVDALRRNTRGWGEQVNNISAHVES